MSEWHIFTKDYQEYTGPSLSLHYSGFATITRTGRTKIMSGKWFGLKTKVTYEDYTIVDVMIPLNEINRIERWDVAQEKKETNE
jgi:hypothetical protein